VTARYWALAQFSSYIRGGAMIYPLALDKNAYSLAGNSRDNAGSLASHGPLAVVAQNPDGQVVVVLTNPTGQSQPLSPRQAVLCPRTGASLAAGRLKLQLLWPSAPRALNELLRGRLGLLGWGRIEGPLPY